MLYQPKQKEFISHRKVYFGDTDAAGVVYHGRYVYWMESARIDFLEALGLPYQEILENKIHFVPVEIKLNYQKSLKFGDKFQIATFVSEILRSSFIVKNTFLKDDHTICQAYIKLACVDGNKWKPTRLIPELVEHLIEFEK